MSARSPFNVKVKSYYNNGVLFYQGTQNKFNLMNFFEFSLEPGVPFILDQDSTLQLYPTNKPSGFTLVSGTTYTYTYSPQFLTSPTGQTMNVDFVYIQYYPLEPGETTPTIQMQLNARAKLKIVVQ